MADDLDNFFKKKANKKKKKPVVQNIEKLGKKLEKSAKLQEEIDRENEAAAEREKNEEQFIQNRLQEDTEWIDFGDKEVNIQDLNIKDMDVGQQTEEVDENGPDAVVNNQEKVRTWNVPNENEKPVENGTPEPEAPQKPQAYMAPHMRRAGAQVDKPDINNEMAFPSLGAADEIEEKEKQREKKEEAYRLQKLEEQRRSNVQSSEKPAAAMPPSEPGKGSYVPPHLRNAGAGPGGAGGRTMYDRPSGPVVDSQGYQTQNQRRMGSSTGTNAWARPANVAPVNNRFDGLRDS